MFRTAALALVLVFALTSHARAQDPPDDEPEAVEAADQAESPDEDSAPEAEAADHEASGAGEATDLAEDDPGAGVGVGEAEAAPATAAAEPAATPAPNPTPAPPAPAPPAAAEKAPTQAPCGSTGTVKSYNAEKGYGWITSDGGGPDVFVHSSSLLMDHPRLLLEGQKVQFQCTVGPKGRVATSVRAA